jgi:hypothetical protein
MAMIKLTTTTTKVKMTKIKRAVAIAKPRRQEAAAGE